MFRRFTLFALVSFLVSPAPALRAQGGPPFITDDPGTPGDGHWEINVAWIHEARSDERVDELPLLDINYGLGESIQLKYEVSRLLSHPAGSARQSGWSNSEAGVKWRFYDHEEQGLSLSTYPQFEFRNPGSHSAARGLTEDENTWVLPVELEQVLGPWSVTVEAGGVVPSQSPAGWIYGVVLGRTLAEKIEAGVELHSEASRTFADTELAANLGLRYAWSEHVSLLGSIGRELHNDFAAQARLLSYVALQFVY